MPDISWQDLVDGKPLQQDRIKLSIADNDDPDVIYVRLSLLGAVNWWKGLELKNSNDQRVGDVEAEGAQIGLAEFEWDAVDQGSIVLWKAKTFGARTPIYRVQIPPEAQGKRLSFRWAAD
ncbi:hypothetical protein [Parafrankia sp. BMG5.11]|uniref:hypothetical protein n=1 Tax=Parafrankia sp. BMG5.11 TaxID=222540 RepID=UPI00103FE0FA|nr:hypothetical protein [Parafrankia sp. BMG5.11]TCJ40732.1 hypothetical protein E0504_03920 [Parafrankia sp. BMG5.11]